MPVSDNTIAAIITPPGEGGIAAVRVAGKQSVELLRSHFRTITNKKLHADPEPFLMQYGQFVDGKGEVVDEVLAVFMPEGNSYTGLDQVEFFCHGGRVVVEMILGDLIRSGARAAEPGEFTRMAFLSGRIDLTQAEAVVEIISANTSSSHRSAREHLTGAYREHISVLRSRMIDLMAEIEALIDFPEEEIDPANHSRLLSSVEEIIERLSELSASFKGGRIIREGFVVAIAGRPNAGKSSLFNLLLKKQRALVMPTAGTTRDYLSEWLDIEGVAVNMIDTAGLRASGGPVEKAGQKNAEEILASADLVLWMVDLSARGWKGRLEGDLESLVDRPKLLTYNKVDLVQESPLDGCEEHSSVNISCKTGDGIDALRAHLARQIAGQLPDLTDGYLVTSARHHQKLSLAEESMVGVKRKLSEGESPELVAFDLRQGINWIDEITGKVYTEEVLDEIFSKFCIGK